MYSMNINASMLFHTNKVPYLCTVELVLQRLPFCLQYQRSNRAGGQRLGTGDGEVQE